MTLGEEERLPSGCAAWTRPPWCVVTTTVRWRALAPHAREVIVLTAHSLSCVTSPRSSSLRVSATAGGYQTPMDPIRIGLVDDPAAPTKIAQGMTDLAPQPEPS